MVLAEIRTLLPIEYVVKEPLLTLSVVQPDSDLPVSAIDPCPGMVIDTPLTDAGLDPVAFVSHLLKLARKLVPVMVKVRVMLAAVAKNDEPGSVAVTEQIPAPTGVIVDGFTELSTVQVLGVFEVKIT